MMLPKLNKELFKLIFGILDLKTNMPFKNKFNIKKYKRWIISLIFRILICRKLEGKLNLYKLIRISGKLILGKLEIKNREFKDQICLFLMILSNKN